MPDLPFAANPLRTRADVQRLLVDLVQPLVPHFSAGRAQVHLGANRALYGDPAGWLEGYARPLWGLVPLAAGGGSFPHWPLWQTGLVNGTDPAHPEYWGLPGNYDQRSVEQAAFGLGLALAPQHFWEPLPPVARARVAAWLGRINEVELVRSNWLYFRVLVNLGLRRCGQPWDEARVEADFALLEGFYRRDGWYADGGSPDHFRDGRTGDYYVPMAFQFYSLIYARLASDFDPVRAARFVERGRLFAREFQHYFAADGTALPFGRSLSYRFAQGAFWGGLAFAAVEALPWGVIKGLYLRHLRAWMQQPIFSETGLLTIGYAYPNLLPAESYNSPGSPYWALKAFLPLALPATHPFWQAEEQPLPPRAAVRTLPGAKLILVTGRGSGDVTAINPGQPTLDWPRHAPHKYSKCAYSTRLGFAVPASVGTPAEGGLDSVIALSDDGRFFRHREQCFDAVVHEGVAAARWSPWPDVTLHTWLLAEPDGHLRIHHLGTGRPLWSVDAGFAVPHTGGATREHRPQDAAGPLVRGPAGASLVRDLSGGRRPECTDLGANSHLLASLSAMPLLRAQHAPGAHWLATWVAGSGDPAETFAAAASYTVEFTASGPRVQRAGKPWWSLEFSAPGGSAAPAPGHSSAARLAALAELV